MNPCIFLNWRLCVIGPLRNDSNLFQLFPCSELSAGWTNSDVHEIEWITGLLHLIIKSSTVLLSILFYSSSSVSLRFDLPHRRYRCFPWNIPDHQTTEYHVMWTLNGKQIPEGIKSSVWSLHSFLQTFFGLLPVHLVWFLSFISSPTLSFSCA